MTEGMRYQGLHVIDVDGDLDEMMCIDARVVGFATDEWPDACMLDTSFGFVRLTRTSRLLDDAGACQGAVYVSHGAAWRILVRV